MIAHIISALSGRTKHWIDANNSYVNVLTERAKSFPPAIKPLFLQFVAGSWFIVDALVGPTKGRKRIFKKDLKTITSSEFRELHNMTIWGFIGLFVRQNPEWRDSFSDAGVDFIGVTEKEKQFAQSIIDSEDIDLGAIGGRLLEEFSHILRYKEENLGQVTGYVMLTTLFGSAYKTAIESYKEELSKLGNVEPSAAPNDDTATPVSNSDGPGGPSSVS